MQSPKLVHSWFRSPLLWIMVIVLGWGALMILARQADISSITWTNKLFGWMIILTYVSIWAVAIGVSRIPRRTIFGGITFTAMIVVLLLCVELPAILGVVNWDLIIQRLTGNAQNTRWAFKYDRQLEFRRIPYDFWEGRPSSDIEYGWMMPPSIRRSLSFTYDRWGYRNLVDLDQADVALIGDSYVEGWYVSDKETTATQLQASLGRPVVNLGVSGYGTMQEFRVLKIDSIRFSPKVVIWFFFEGNDLYDDSRFGHFLEEEATQKETKSTKLQEVVDDRWMDRLFTRSILPLFRGWSTLVLPSHTPYVGTMRGPHHAGQAIYFSRYAAVPWDDWTVNQWERARTTLSESWEFSRERKIRMLFVFVPIKFRVYQPYVTFDPGSPCRAWNVWPILELFTKFCKTQNTPCLNLTQYFQDSIRTGGMPYSPVDSHWTPEGHALVANLLVSELVKRGWLSGSSSANSADISNSQLLSQSRALFEPWELNLDKENVF